MRRFLWIPWRWWRRAGQVAVLLLFLWLFRRTEYSGADVLPGGENLFFRLDPLAGLAAMLAGREYIAQFWPALVLVALTLILGRFFCGWICPLGTLLDCFHRLVAPLARVTNRLTTAAVTNASQENPNSRRLTASGQAGRNVRYAVLLAVLSSALLAFPLIGFVDPFALLVRGLTFWADPALYRGVTACFQGTSEGWAGSVVRPFVTKHLLPFRAPLFHLAGVSAAILGAIFLLELVAQRFWCRYLCPLGGLLGLVSRWSLVKRLPVKVCKPCGQCATTCRMAALDSSSGLSPEACTLCMDCVDACPKGIAKFAIAKKSQSRVRPVDLSRRGVLSGIAAGAAIPGIALAAGLGHKTPVDPTLLRPPGGEDERRFLDLCIRCGECMKVCPTNVLQPAIFEAGLEGMFSPRLALRLIFEQSYCEYACTLCGQVCPTGAIPLLTEEAKHGQPTGKAYFVHHFCLPWAKNESCIRCEEMCPAPEKAIKILRTFTVKDKDGDEVEIHQPYVDRDLCVGCGICECNCPVEGVGIRVRRVDAPDPGTEFLLNPTSASILGSGPLASR